MKKFTVVAHRGFSGIAPENTISAIDLAVAAGSPAIEIDVHQTSDDQIILIHDSTLNRTTTGRGKIQSYSYSDLKSLDAGLWFDKIFKNEKIPLLSEVLKKYKDKIKIIIEVKYGSEIYPDIEKNICELLEKYDCKNNLVVSSSESEILAKFRSLDSKINLAKILTLREMSKSLFSNGDFVENLGLECGLVEIHPHWTYITPSFIKWAKSHNLLVSPWTVNKEPKMQRLLKLGIDGIITNFPDIALKLT